MGRLIHEACSWIVIEARNAVHFDNLVALRGRSQMRRATVMPSIKYFLCVISTHHVASFPPLLPFSSVFDMAHLLLTHFFADLASILAAPKPQRINPPHPIRSKSKQIRAPLKPNRIRGNKLPRIRRVVPQGCPLRLDGGTRSLVLAGCACSARAWPLPNLCSPPLPSLRVRVASLRFPAASSPRKRGALSLRAGARPMGLAEDARLLSPDAP